MKERPILFNAEMVKAILSGRKTQTRRVIKLPLIDKNMGCELAGNELAGEVSAGDYRNCPLWPGDQLWVRETFEPLPDHEEPVGCSHILYAADIPFPNRKWTPSIHMPRWASRIDLLITGVRVERLNSISDNDAIAEGLERYNDDGIVYYGQYGRGDCRPEVAYRDLWQSIYGAENWQSNPWVWVIEFERVAPAGER